MALSAITFTVVDGGLGILPPDNGNLQVAMGCCSKGIPGTFYALGSIGAITQNVGYGPLAEAMALKMANGGAVQYGYVLPQTNTGALSVPVHTGGGVGTITLADGPDSTITVLCTLGGAFATAKFNFAIGNAPAGLPVTSTASPWAYAVPGTSTVLTLTSAGGTTAFTAGDVYAVAATGTITPGGSNVTTNTLAQVSQPFDQYEGAVQILTTGGFGVSTFQWALDYRVTSDGTDISNYSAPIIVPSGGKYAIPQSGVYLNFAQPTILVKITTGGALGTMQFDVNVAGGGYTGSPVTSSATASTTYAVAGTNALLTFSAAVYVLNDVWTVSAINVVTHTTGAGPGAPTSTSTPWVAGALNTFLVAPPSASNADILAGGTVLIADQTHSWSIMQVVGVPVSASAAATTESTCDSVATLGFAAYRFFRVLSECPTVNSIVISSVPIYDTADTDNVVSAAFASSQSTQGRTQVGAGDFDCVSPITGRFQRRNAIWQEAARLNVTPISDDPGKTANGSLSFIRAVYRDEAQVPALDAARLVTLRTYSGVPGFYISAGPTLALVTSDFAQIPNCRVLDRACAIAYLALFPYLRSSLPVDTTTGFILPAAKAKIEGVVNGILRAGLVSNGQASGVQMTIDGTSNILSTGILPTTIVIVPLAPVDEISVRIGFINPALA